MNDIVLDTKCSYFAEAKLFTVNEDQVSESGSLNDEATGIVMVQN